MDKAEFVRAVASSSLAQVPSTDVAAAAELFLEYDRVLRSLAEVFAPARTVQTQQRPLTPWFDSECRAQRHQCRRLERCFRRSLVDEDRQTWITALRGKRAFLEAKKNDYWTTWLAAEGHDARLLWRSMNNVLRQGKESGLQLAPVSHTADDFQNFFQSKVLTIRSATSVPSTSTTVSSTCGVQAEPASLGAAQRPLLMTWREVSVDEVCRIVMAAPVKSSSLDPVPTTNLSSPGEH